MFAAVFQYAGSRMQRADCQQLYRILLLSTAIFCPKSHHLVLKHPSLVWTRCKAMCSQCEIFNFSNPELALHPTHIWCWTMWVTAVSRKSFFFVCNFQTLCVFDVKFSTGKTLKGISCKGCHPMQSHGCSDSKTTHCTMRTATPVWVTDFAKGVLRLVDFHHA